ncbi:hypothetical protein CDAR_20731 [Caerostris darwini]|uniref:Uncharacterized protein n=1 Tax=Caerostris darwini TaxID=1538125 RepID=A0AAV4QGC0_9ARAC|nr:hypothetical protein CDAR_20731 [Caerostris darwini]
MESFRIQSESRVSPQIDFFSPSSGSLPIPLLELPPSDGECPNPKKGPFCLDYRVSRVSAAANRGKMAAPNLIICPVGPHFVWKETSQEMTRFSKM